MGDSDAQPYLWHWRPRKFTPDCPPDEKFWIGVCQWRPYKRGTGLTREVVARVYGYAGDPQGAYDIAADLCRRLNEAKADFQSPPAWLRKQYTAPRPKSVAVVRKPGQPLTGAQVRSVRQRVMREQLLPAGFIEAVDSNYVRLQGNQLHAIHFQPAQYGGKFTVNLGFHYTFIPPIGNTRPRPLREWQHVNCAFRARIGSFLPDREDTWFEYGADRDALGAVFTSCATGSLAALDRCATDWSDPVISLQTITKPWFSPGPLARACIYLQRGRWPGATAELEAMRQGSVFLENQPERQQRHLDMMAKLTAIHDRQSAGADPATDPAARLPDWVLP